MSELNVVNGGNLSLMDLKNFKQAGYAVVRTGHLGNHYLSNLLLHNYGIPGEIFDKNLLLTDENYHPSYTLQDGWRLPIAEKEDVLVPFARLSDYVHQQNTFVAGRTNPGQIHYDSLLELFGEEDICSESGFMNENQALLEKLVDIIAKVYPELFFRCADDRGKTFLRKILPGNASREVINFNAASFSRLLGQEPQNFQGGTIPKIEATIVMGTVIKAILSGQNRIFEISGPAAINYALNKSFVNSMNKLYRLIRKEILSLPEKLELVIVPSFYFRLGSLWSEKAEMDQLWDSLKKFSETIRNKREVLRNFFSESLNLSEVNIQREQLSARFNQELDRLARDIFSASIMVERMDFSQKDFSKYPVLKETFFSQYDLSAAGERLYVPDEIQCLSMLEVEEYFRIMNIAKGRIS